MTAAPGLVCFKATDCWTSVGVHLQVITRTASIRVAEYAFKYARDNQRAKVTAVHKVRVL